MITRTCPICHGQVQEADCITEEANVCPLADPCVRPVDEAAWPFPEPGDDDDETVEPVMPVAPAAA